MNLRASAILTIALSTTHVSGQQLAGLPDYVPAHQVSGLIRSWGSPQMAALMKTWEDGFKHFQPGIEFQDNLHGTASAVAGVYSRRADLALLARDIWPSEVEAFSSVYGHDPATVQVATGSFDIPKATYALMVFVNKDNPLEKLTLAELEAIFGNDNHSSMNGIRTWGELGLTGEWTNKAIRLYGFDLDNDKSIAFSRMVFKRTRRWNCRVQEFSNSTSGDALDAGQLILKALARDRYGIAISNLHYSTSGTKVLAIAVHRGGPFVMPSKASAQSRLYPLVRSVHIVIDRSPNRPINPTVLEFLRYILSRQGQADVSKEETYLPLTDEIVHSELSRLESEPSGRSVPR
jgi:phosphate transport system substrate-binding protein